jgi:NAD(P)-dependent dehydrogenase (short-subunit alcohol dehydrogenase family)
MTAYTTSKHALLGLAVCLARDLADDGIGVSLLCPSYVATERLRAMATESADVQAILRDYAQEPEQVARQAFDGMASRQLVVPTNGLSTAFVTELHTAIVNAMPQPLEDRP